MPTNACSARNYSKTFSRLHLHLHRLFSHPSYRFIPYTQTFFPGTLIALNLFNAPLISDQIIHIELKSHKNSKQSLILCNVRCAYSALWLNSCFLMPALIANIKTSHCWLKGKRRYVNGSCFVFHKSREVPAVLLPTQET